MTVRSPAHGPGGQAFLLASATKFARTGDSGPFRKASDSLAIGGSGAISRNTTPGTCRQDIERGTMATPSPAATRLMVEPTWGAHWPSFGSNPRSLQADMMAW